MSKFHDAHNKLHKIAEEERAKENEIIKINKKITLEERKKGKLIADRKPTKCLKCNQTMYLDFNSNILYEGMNNFKIHNCNKSKELIKQVTDFI